MRIREFLLEDHPAVVALWKEAGLVVKPGDDVEGVKLKLTRDPDLFLVAEEGDRIIGSVMGSWDGRRGWIWHLAVKPSSQRKRVGAELVREVEERVARKGGKRVLALVSPSNRRSFDFFTARGYGSDDVKVMFRDVGKKRVSHE